MCLKHNARPVTIFVSLFFRNKPLSDNMSTTGRASLARDLPEFFFAALNSHRRRVGTGVYVDGLKSKDYLRNGKLCPRHSLGDAGRVPGRTIHKRVYGHASAAVDSMCHNNFV